MGLVAHTVILTTIEAETGGSRVQRQPAKAKEEKLYVIETMDWPGFENPTLNFQGRTFYMVNQLGNPHLGNAYSPSNNHKLSIVLFLGVGMNFCSNHREC
ncbi:rCG27339 [Rattus norvegicus]|uniref:RCG27339 n=1 Tax=Rattus norvegicus TaxID=10116 RepID=A6HQI8_RAT|nr:rCG27339 [Rattus norvegicus]